MKRITFSCEVVMKLGLVCLSMVGALVGCSTGEATGESEARATAANVECHSTGTDLGNGYFEIRRETLPDGSAGSTIEYGYDSRFETQQGTSFGVLRTRKLFFLGKTVDQLKGLVSYDPEVLQVAAEGVTMAMLALECSATPLPAPEPPPAGRQCSGSGLGEDSFVIANHRFFDGSIGAKIGYTQNTTQFTTAAGTTFPIATTNELVFPDTTVDAVKGLVSEDPEVLNVAHEGLTLDKVGLVCE